MEVRITNGFSSIRNALCINRICLAQTPFRFEMAKDDECNEGMAAYQAGLPKTVSLAELEGNDTSQLASPPVGLYTAL
jgi:hypothetical protein